MSDSEKEARKIGTPVDEFVSKGERENLKHQLSNVVNKFNECINVAHQAKLNFKLHLNEDNTLVLELKEEEE